MSGISEQHTVSQRKIILACNSLDNHRINPIFHTLQIFISIPFLRNTHLN